MAKKGQQQSFQYEINSDEELFKYIDRKGVIVLDIYTEWCGPCIGMLNNLKKVKLEIGGDNLHLAIVKADTVDTFVRFRNKSEPTWMFIMHKRATQLMFGANVPRLTQIITKELELVGRKTDRKNYALDELQPIEIEILEAKRKIQEENQRKEREALEFQRRTYLNYCTALILEYLTENGIIIFGPHIGREQLKKVMEIAEKEKLQPKDRKTIILEQSQIDTLNYACNNPLDPKVLEHMFGKEIIVVLWKLADGDTRTIEEALFTLRDLLSKPQQDEHNAENILPPLLPPLEIRIYAEEEKPAVEEVIEEQPTEVATEDIEDVSEEEKGEEGETAENENEIEPEGEKKEGAEGGETEEKKDEEKGDEEEKGEVGQELEKEESLIPLRTINVPTAWTPGNKRTNAAGIYVFFRHQTANFLPPDPVPDPPHLIVAFDAYKKREISNLISKWHADVLSYGFFTSEDPRSAELIANSTKAYEAQKSKMLPTDKIIVKISKKTSHCLLAFAKSNPTYVSENCVVGEEEAKKLFPKEYKTGEQIEAELAAQEKEHAKKRKSKKKEEKGEEDKDGDTADNKEGNSDEPSEPKTE